MKWIGQHIYDLVSRFRENIIVEDSDVIIKDSDGSAITMVPGDTGATLGYSRPLTILQPVNDASPQIVLGSSLEESLRISSFYYTESQTLQAVLLSTFTESATANFGLFRFKVDGTNILDIDDGGIDLDANMGISINGTDILTDSSGTATLSRIDALDVTTEATIEASIDTLGNLTSFGASGATTNIVAGDLTMYNAVNDGNPTISLGSSATNRFEIKSVYNSSAQTLCDIDFTTYTASGTNNDGRYNFYVDEVLKLVINDDSLVAYTNILAYDADAQVSVTDTTTSSATQGGKLRLRANDGAAMGDDHRLGVIEFVGAEDSSSTYSIGAHIQAICRDAWDGSNNDADLEFYTTDGTTESKVLTLDADKLATFAGAVTVTGALTGTLATVSQPNITGVGTIGTGVWQGTAVASAYMASGTDSAKGALELATDAEAVTATDTARAVTPANLKARVSQIVNLKGYATLQDDVYDFANPFATDDEAPFQLDEDYGSGTIGSGTEVTQGKFFRAGGFHVPFACTVSALQTQITCNNAGNVSIALVEYRPSDASGDQSDYPRTVYETVVNASDDSNNKVDTVTIAAGDLDATAVPDGSHLMIMVKGDGTSAGGTAVISVAVGLSW